MVDASWVVAEASNKFAVDLHMFLGREASFASTNLFYSPASLFIALAMTCFGAKGKTAGEIQRVLHVASLSKPDLDNNMKKLLSSLNAASDNNTKLLTANKLFIEKSIEVLETFKNGTREFYDAEVGLVDYKFHAEQVREEINQWVEEKTNDTIKDLILPGMLNADTKLSLVNAIYFKGLWLEPFNKKSTFLGSFFVAENQKILVPMMYQLSMDFKLSESEQLACQILEMPYVGNKLSMVILLPLETNGLASLEEKMNFENLQKSLSDLDSSTPDELEVYLPKFKLTQRFELNDVLARMGAGEMFAPGKADFTGIVQEPLYVSNVVHKAFVEVNEEGTEAAAATGIEMQDSVNPVFNANHPFVFLIRHVDTGAILFLGRLMKPTAEA